MVASLGLLVEPVAFRAGGPSRDTAIAAAPESAWAEPHPASGVMFVRAGSGTPALAGGYGATGTAGPAGSSAEARRQALFASTDFREQPTARESAAPRYTHLTFAGVGLTESPARARTTWSHSTIGLEPEAVTEVLPIYTAQWLEREAASGPTTFENRATAGHGGSWSTGAGAPSGGAGFQAEFTSFAPAR
jgi:hypothetical protein